MSLKVPVRCTGAYRHKEYCILAYTRVTVFSNPLYEFGKNYFSSYFLIQKTQLLSVKPLFHFMLNELMLKSL